MDAVTKNLLNHFSDSQPALQIPGAPAAVASIKLGDLIEAGSNPQAATVAAIPASANLTVPVVAAAAVENTDITATQLAVVAADLNAALDNKADNADLVTLASEVEARLDTIESKINAVIAALKAAGLMA
jgi:hypothetical protein